MKKIIQLAFFLLLTVHAYGQYDENKEKITIISGFLSTGSKFVFSSDNVYGGNFQVVYDVLKIEEGSIGLKASGAWADGFSGYYGGANLRIESRFFGDLDLLFGHSQSVIKNYYRLTQEKIIIQGVLLLEI